MINWPTVYYNCIEPGTRVALNMQGDPSPHAPRAHATVKFIHTYDDGVTVALVQLDVSGLFLYIWPEHDLELLGTFRHIEVDL